MLCGALIFHLTVAGQSPSELALKKIQKQKWQRANALLIKALTKDSLNVTAKYVLAQYFFSEGNPAFHLDSARHYAQSALNDFQNTTLKQRDRLKRFPMDLIRLIRLWEKIDSAAFDRAKTLSTENALGHFILYFPLSSKIKLATEMRDSIAFAEAVKANLYQAFQNFLNKYPEARQLGSAKEKYGKLLFAEKTSAQTLASYETFLIEYPDTPFRAVVEQTVFEYRTASGETKTFVDFVKDYPHSASAKKAKNILFHLIPESDRELEWPENFLDDSLMTVINRERGYLVPFLRNGKFGFMDERGQEVIQAEADTINLLYQCGNIDEDVISLLDKIVSNNGTVILKEKIATINDLGFGFLLVEGEGCRSLIHKTGFRIAGCIDDAKILNGKLVALLKGKQWSVWTLTGRLLKQDLEDVFCIKDVIVVKRNAKFKPLTVLEISVLPAQPELNGNENEFDEVKPWANDLIFVRNGDTSGLMDQSLNFYVGLENHVLNPAFFGVISASSSGLFIFSSTGQKSNVLRQVIANDPWVAAKLDSSWRLYNPKSFQYLSPEYDTIIFTGPFAIGHKKDSIRIYFSKHYSQQWLQSPTVEFIPGQDSSVFLVVEQGDKKNVYDRNGQLLFATKYDKIQYAGNDLFIVHKKEKKGLITNEGKLLLPVEYDAIGTIHQGVVSLLRSLKFGLFDCEKRKLIKPVYNKNIAPYNSHVITAHKDGLYGFIGWDNNPLSKFEFSDVQYWNDTTALVKKNSKWMIYEIKTKKILLDRIKDFKIIRETPVEKLAVIHQDENYGALHNQKGTIIPVSFSDVINVGSVEEPMYFTEKHIVEASVFVVIYYNSKGEMLRKEVYDQEDYDKIYCHSN